MYLRNLEIKDAPLMLEWMHDKNVTENLYTDFSTKTIDDAIEFIKNSCIDTENIHLAIASDIDEYMGTVSLKHIDRELMTAEFAITVRKSAMHKGYSWFGMKTIIEKAFNEFGLESVYWCVSKSNLRAVRFYDKHNFHEALDISSKILERYKKVNNLKWYSVLKGDSLNRIDSVAGCKIVNIKTISTVNAGELSFFQEGSDIDFPIKRIYYISKVPEGIRRGFHAHKKLKQILFCPYGSIQLTLENKNMREEIELSDPSIGVCIEGMVWREMLWLKKDSVLCVAASELYDENDYIRDYKEFKRYVEGENINK